MGDRDWRPAIGAKVELCGTHPATGERGAVVNHFEWMGIPSIRVELETGDSKGSLVVATTPSSIKVLC